MGAYQFHQLLDGTFAHDSALIGSYAQVQWSVMGTVIEARPLNTCVGVHASPAVLSAYLCSDAFAVAVVK